jgi:N-acetylneuraminic acid mutarotase
MPTPRINVAVVACQNKIYVIGGRATYFLHTNGAANYAGVATNEAYDPSTDTWQTEAPMPIARASLQASVVNGKIYAMGGIIDWIQRTPDVTNVNEVYDPQTNTWASAVPIPIGVSSIDSEMYSNVPPTFGMAVVDNKIYVIGGVNTSFVDGHPDSVALALNQIYDPATDNWSSGAPLPIATDYPVAVATSGAMATKAIYVFGVGNIHENSSYLNQVYNPETNGWTEGTRVLSNNLPFNLPCELTAVNVNDELYVIGGAGSEYSVDSLIPDNPPPPFLGINLKYTPFGYMTFSALPTPLPTSTSQITVIPLPTMPSTVFPSIQIIHLNTGFSDFAILSIAALILLAACLLVIVIVKFRKKYRSPKQS